MIEIHANIKEEIIKANQIMKKPYVEWEPVDVVHVAEAYLSLRAIYTKLKEEGKITYRGYQRRKLKVKEWKELKDAWLYEEVSVEFREGLMQK